MCGGRNIIFEKITPTLEVSPFQDQLPFKTRALLAPATIYENVIPQQHTYNSAAKYIIPQQNTYCGLEWGGLPSGPGSLMTTWTAKTKRYSTGDNFAGRRPHVVNPTRATTTHRSDQVAQTISVNLNSVLKGTYFYQYLKVP